MDDHLQGCAEEFVEHLMDKIAQIHSQSKHGANPLEMPEEQTCQIIWEWFDSVGPDKVDRIFGDIKATAYLLLGPPGW